MATRLKNLSKYKTQDIPSAAKMNFGIVVSEWNNEVTDPLLKGVIDTFKAHGATEKNISIKYVPGSFELPLGAQFILKSKDIDAVICLGCVIQGETRHFDFICDAVSNGIMTTGLNFNKPVIFGLLTTNTLQQAKDRSGGKYGNKGIEAAVTAIKMVALKNECLKKH
jgi:6,7-dimethyl-8-ribityllumazine synthase